MFETSQNPQVQASVVGYKRAAAAILEYPPLVLLLFLRAIFCNFWGPTGPKSSNKQNCNVYYRLDSTQE